MFYTKKEKRKLKTELKKELRNEIEEIINNYTEFNNTSRTSYNNLYDMHAENNQELFEAIQKMYDKIIRLENDVKKLSRHIEKIEQTSKAETNSKIVSPQATNRDRKTTNTITNNAESTNEGFCSTFNKYINTGSMHSDFKSINLSYEVDKFSETDSGTALYYIVQLYDDMYELYPNHRFVDRRACQRAEMAFDFDIQGNERICVNKPCRLRKLMYGYAVEEKGSVSIL